VFEGTLLTTAWVTANSVIAATPQTAPPAITSVIGSNNYSDEVIRQYYEGMYQNISGSSLSSCLVHMHYHPCGLKAVMLAHLDITSSAGSGINIVPQRFLNTNEAGYDICLPSDINVVNVRSIVQLNQEQATLAVIFSLTVQNVNNLTVGTPCKFNLSLPGAVGATSLVRQAVQESFSPSSAYSQSISQIQATFQPVSAQSQTLKLYITLAPCFWKHLWRSIVHTLSPILREGVGLLAGAGCAVAAGFLTENPAAATVAAGVCSSAAISLYDNITSNIGVEDSDSKPPKKQKKVSTVPSAKQIHDATHKIITDGRQRKESIKRKEEGKVHVLRNKVKKDQKLIKQQQRRRIVATRKVARSTGKKTNKARNKRRS